MEIYKWIVSGAWIPFASLLALVVSVILYALAWGTRDAQKAAIETWQNLAESRGESIDELTKKTERLEREVHQLRTEQAANAAATQKAIDELVKGFQRALEERDKK